MVQDIDVFIKKIEKGNYNSEECNAIGLSLIGTWNFKSAEKIFRALLKKEGDTNRGRNLNNLGLSLRFQEKFKEAEKIFQEAYDWDKKQVGEEKAKGLPAFQNLMFLKEKILPAIVPATEKFKRRILVPVKLRRESLKINKEGFGKLTFSKIFYEEIIAGGLIAGSILFILQDLLSIFNFYERLGLSFIVLALSLFVLTREIYFNDIT